MNVIDDIMYDVNLEYCDKQFKMYPLRARRGEKKTTTRTEISFSPISNGLMEKWPPIKMRG